MKKNIIAYFIFFISLHTTANPIVEHLFSELLFVDGEWQLELTNIYGSLSDAYLITKADTAGFREGIDISNEFIVVEQKDLFEELKIDQAGDTLWLKGEGYSDMFYWGDSGLVAAPVDGQSICAESYLGNNINYYLDNTPTVGTENDTLNALGTVAGIVTDMNNIPIPDVKVIYDYVFFDETYVYTDENGYFTFQNISKINILQFRKAGYESVFKNIQIYPEQKIIADTVRLMPKSHESRFYPLEVGNKWVYQTVGYNWNDDGPADHFYYESIKEVFGDTLLENGESYFVINGGLGTYFERYSEDLTKVWIYADNDQANDNHEILSYDLSTEVGDTVHAAFSDYKNFSDYTYQYHYEDSTSLVIFGITSKKKLFQELYSLGGQYYQLAKNFGIVRSEAGWDFGEAFTYLKGCIIDGVVYGDTSLIVAVEDEEILSNNFSLSQNYPNPFNPTTKIKFTIATPPVSSPLAKGRTKEGFVTLKVYDILGREIVTLIDNKPMKPGEYEVEFDGSSLPSGVYFYRIISGDFMKTRKMALIK